VGLAWSEDAENDAGGYVATVRVSRTRQTKCDDPDEKGYPGPSRWGLGDSLTTSTLKKWLLTQPQRSVRRNAKHKTIWL